LSANSPAVGLYDAHALAVLQRTEDLLDYVEIGVLAVLWPS
jgi:hypothetical protein